MDLRNETQPSFVEDEHSDQYTIWIVSCELVEALQQENDSNHTLGVGFLPVGLHEILWDRRMIFVPAIIGGSVSVEECSSKQWD